MSDDDIGDDDFHPGTTRWFGESWGAPVCAPRAEVPTPVGKLCQGHAHMHHELRPEAIAEGDQGVMIPHLHPVSTEWWAWHLDCWLHEIGVDRLQPKQHEVGGPGWSVADLD
jgi:hypothetical protein